MRIDGIGMAAQRAMAATFAPALAPALPDALALNRLADRMLGGTTDAQPGTALASPAAAPAPTPTSPQTLGSVQMLVTLAAVSPAEERRRIQSAQARNGLDMLDRLHRELLSGTPSRATLDRLNQWLQSRPDAETMRQDDPKFAALFDDIDLRVRVELAKFDIEA